MKKTIAIISLIIAFFVIYFLQTNFFTWFTINGIMPNLFVILVLFIGLFAGRKLGFAFGIVFGLILDLLLGRTIGVSAFLLAIIGLVSEYLDKSFSKDSRIMIIITTIAGTIFFEVGYYIFKIIKFGAIFEFIPFISPTAHCCPTLKKLDALIVLAASSPTRFTVNINRFLAELNPFISSIT